MATEARTDRFTELCSQFPLRPIRSDEHHKRAVEFAMAIDDDGIAGDEYDYRNSLLTLIEKYEDAQGKSDASRTAFGGRLRYLIEDARGETVADTARATGIEEAAIVDLIEGRRPIDKEMAATFARHFNVGTSLFLEP